MKLRNQGCTVTHKVKQLKPIVPFHRFAIKLSGIESEVGGGNEEDILITLSHFPFWFKWVMSESTSNHVHNAATSASFWVSVLPRLVTKVLIEHRIDFNGRYGKCCPKLVCDLFFESFLSTGLPLKGARIISDSPVDYAWEVDIFE